MIVALSDSESSAPAGLRAGEAASGIVTQRRRIVTQRRLLVNVVSRRWVFVIPLPALPGPCFFDGGVRRRILLALADHAG